MGEDAESDAKEQGKVEKEVAYAFGEKGQGVYWIDSSVIGAFIDTTGYDPPEVTRYCCAASLRIDC